MVQQYFISPPSSESNESWLWRRLWFIAFFWAGFTVAQRERAQEDFKVPYEGAPPHALTPNSCMKDSHSTVITLDSEDGLTLKLWRWLPHSLSKRQSPTAVLLWTPIIRMIIFNQGNQVVVVKSCSEFL